MRINEDGLGELDVSVRFDGDIRPKWFQQLEDALDQAAREGWFLTRDITLEGHPFTIYGVQKMASWGTTARRDRVQEAVTP